MMTGPRDTSMATDEEIMDTIRGLGEMAQKVLTYTRWKDGIEIELPSADARNFARWIIQSYELRKKEGA